MVSSIRLSTAVIRKETVIGTTLLASKDYALIDLHLHLDGSLPLHTVRELASMQGVSLPESDRALMARLQVDEDCKDLNDYLEKFFFVVSLLQRKDAITAAAYQLAEELRQQGLLYAEIRFAPQLHTEKGLSQTEIIEAAIEGIRKSVFHANLILCCLRNDCNRKENLETVHLAKTYLGKGVCAVDLAGAEALFPTADFAEEFALANALGVPLTIHAGEAAGPESVVDALAFHPMRVGHGVRSMEDGALVARLAREGIPLELCPTSNLNTHIFGCMGEYPHPKTINSQEVTTMEDNKFAPMTDDTLEAVSGVGKMRHYYTILVDEPTGPRLYQDVPQGEIRPLWKAPGV